MRVDLFDRMDAAQKADALAGSGAVDCSSLLQSVVDEYAPRGGCDLYIPSPVRLAQQVVIGDRVGNAFTGFCIRGGGSLQSKLLWAGPSDRPMVKFSRNKFFTASGIAFKNLGAKGTTTGAHLTGPAGGTQCNNLAFDQCGFYGFHIGLQAGGGPLGTEAASEIAFNGCTFEHNDTGYLGAGSGNTINIWFRGAALTQNTQYGADLGSGQMGHFEGGATNNNGIASIRLNASWQETFRCNAMRFEMGPSEIAIQMGTGNSAEISACKFVGTAGVPANPVLTGSPKCVMLIGNTFGSITDSGWKTIGSVQNGSEKFLEMVGNTIRGQDLFYINPYDTGMGGMRYSARGNYYNGVMHGIENGSVVWPNRVNV